MGVAGVRWPIGGCGFQLPAPGGNGGWSSVVEGRKGLPGSRVPGEWRVTRKASSIRQKEALPGVRCEGLDGWKVGQGPDQPFAPGAGAGGSCVPAPDCLPCWVPSWGLLRAEWGVGGPWDQTEGLTACWAAVQPGRPPCPASPPHQVELMHPTFLLWPSDHVTL